MKTEYINNILYTCSFKTNTEYLSHIRYFIKATISIQINNDKTHEANNHI